MPIGESHSRALDRERGREHAASWGSVTAEGVLLVALGMLALIATAVTGVISVLFLGAILLAAGVSEVIGAFRHRSRGSGATFLGGVLSGLVGGLIVARPVAGLGTITLLIGLYFAAAGLFRGITALADRYQGWGVDVAYGAVTLALGAYVLASWPESSLWLLGTLIGIELVIRGVAWIASGLALRSLADSSAVPSGGASATFETRARTRR